MRLALPAALLLSVLAAGPAPAQTVDSIRAEAGLAWEMVLCAGLFGLLADAPEPGIDPAEADRVARLTGLGAALVRGSETGEAADLAVATSMRHVEELTALLAGIRQADPAGFAAGVGLEGTAPTCARYADQVADSTGEG